MSLQCGERRAAARASGLLPCGAAVVFLVSVLMFCFAVSPVAAQFGGGGGLDGTPGDPPPEVEGNPPPSETDDLGAGDVLLLVNADSTCSQSIAQLYRQYYPQIQDEQVVDLSGLPVCAGPASTTAQEIITRTQFEQMIAAPVRQHMIDNGLVNSTYVIVTTAGMPYRIEDTDPQFGAAVYPGGSNAGVVVDNRSSINAASVESELALLWQQEPGDESWRMPINNREVNPYQGYQNGLKTWSDERDMLARRETFRWSFVINDDHGPGIEGLLDSVFIPFGGYSSEERRMSPADIYLVARLDGPKAQGECPLGAVDAMLARSAMVSNPADPDFVGYNADISQVVIDHSPRPPAPDEFASAKTYNVPPAYEWLTYADWPIPPGAREYSYPTGHTSGNHYESLYTLLTGAIPVAGDTWWAQSTAGLGCRVLWDDTGSVMQQDDVAPNHGVIALHTYGRNGGDGRSVHYLSTGGPGGAPLFECVPGAVFTSLESFNGVTMFTDVSGSQEKIVNFIGIGGTAAVGHAFEPGGQALIHADFLTVNLLRDDDANGVGDLCLAEAVFSSMPFLSWSEVLIGDPLMRLRVGAGGVVSDLEADGGGSSQQQDAPAAKAKQESRSSGIRARLRGALGQ